MNTKERINALTSCATQTDVADLLRAADAKGYCNSCVQCPVAVYLNKASDAPVNGYIVGTRDSSYGDGRRPAKLFDHSDPLQAFILAFDHEGEYTDLRAKGARYESQHEA